MVEPTKGVIEIAEIEEHTIQWSIEYGHTMFDKTLHRKQKD
jgi:hypothetical protein